MRPGLKDELISLLEEIHSCMQGQRNVGDDWDARLESNIAALRGDVQKSASEETEIFDEDAIGSAIRHKVELQSEIDSLRDKLNGAQHPESTGHFHTQLKDMEIKLMDLNIRIRDLKLSHRAYLRRQELRLDVQIASSMNAFDIEEMGEIKRQCQRKISIINAELLTL